MCHAGTKLLYNAIKEQCLFFIQNLVLENFCQGRAASASGRTKLTKLSTKSWNLVQTAGCCLHLGRKVRESEKLVCDIRHHSVMLCCVCVFVSSILTPSRRSLLLRRLLFHNKIAQAALTPASHRVLCSASFF